MSNSSRKVELSCLGKKGSHVRGDNFSYKYFGSPARDGKAQILSNIITMITIIILMKLIMIMIIIIIIIITIGL